MLDKEQRPAFILTLKTLPCDLASSLRKAWGVDCDLLGFFVGNTKYFWIATFKRNLLELVRTRTRITPEIYITAINGQWLQVFHIGKTLLHWGQEWDRQLTGPSFNGCHWRLYRFGTDQFQQVQLRNLSVWFLWSCAVCLCKCMWHTLIEVW